MAKQIFFTTCPMDCPDTCALEVTVQDGQIQKIAGSIDHPTTQGFICSKIARFSQRVYHKDRLRYPMRRTGPKGTGEFSRISWDDAIREIVGHFQQIKNKWGGEAILPYHYGGSNGLLGEEFLDDYFFARLGASRLTKTLCAAPSTEVAVGMYGKMPGIAFEDYAEARCIILWGANPKVSHIHLVPFLREAKKRGAFIAVIDPKKNFSDSEVDLHLPIWPGTDLPIALSMIHFWQEEGFLDWDFLKQHAVGLETLLAAAEPWTVEKAAEEARISPEPIYQLAQAYADRSPAVIRCGWGAERNRNGGHALAAIMAMPALLGKFAIKGGGYTMSNSGATKLDRAKILGPVQWDTRTLNMTQLGMLLTGQEIVPPIKALFIYNCNPAVTAPNQNAVLRGLSRQDLFTVVFEQVMTDTARYADILLPAVTFLEHREIKKAYGSYVVGGVQPVISPVGEARSNDAVFAALGRAMGWEDAPFTWGTGQRIEKIIDALSLNGSRGNFEKLISGKSQRVDFPGGTPIQFKTVFPQTPDGKIHLAPECLGMKPFRYQPVRHADYPLALLTPASNKMISSTLGEFNFQTLSVGMHPLDAKHRHLKNGDRVRVFNDFGEVICWVKLTDKARQGVVSMAKGAWRRSSLNGLTSTALCPDHVNEVGGGACFNDARVEVEKVEKDAGKPPKWLL